MRRGEKGERKKKEKKDKNKVVQFFLRCSDSRSSVARELKLVYTTRATSRYQEWKDSVLHADSCYGRVMRNQQNLYS